MFSSKIVCSFSLIFTINEVFTQESCFNRELPAPSCITEKNGLSPGEKESILVKHNKLRKCLASGAEGTGSNNYGQPAAAYMPDLEWDEKLAKLAQKWADTCNYGHDRCLFGNAMGQNLGFISHSDESQLNYPSIVQGWYDEVKIFDGSQVENVMNFGGSAHYTQMISANTTKIGCGAIRYKSDGMTRIQLTCNYSPFVNMMGNGLYKKGTINQQMPSSGNPYHCE
ncbi:venom allergen 3-like [Leptopilina boulardi]|uniref:venom allergen 3-like n=1 Tax=Leptopilina boulardi TaxID=63433 RepID=UPI0021F5800D|nr:venom allergen 3-like [Leptopilina boulardi]